MRRRKNKVQIKQWGESFIRDLENVTIHKQRKYTGYGFSEYMMIGDYDAILRECEIIKMSYHPGWYCGSWPKPIEIHQGLWFCDPSHSESCE